MRNRKLVVHIRQFDTYETPPGSAWPIVSLPGIRRIVWAIYFIGVVVWAALRIRFSQRGVTSARDASTRLLWGLEKIGGRFKVTGIQNLNRDKEALVVAGNHMSVVETLVLPAFVMSFKPLVFIIKESLLRYPFFGQILLRMGTLPVGRTNPRADLQKVLTEGVVHLQEGRSLTLFPQSTRIPYFNRSKFSSMAVKLAARAGCKVVPLALKTDMIMPGKRLKDFGPIDPSKTIHLAFGEPIEVKGKGHDEHEAVCDFIEEKVSGWRAEEGLPPMPEDA